MKKISLITCLLTLVLSAYLGGQNDNNYQQWKQDQQEKWLKEDITTFIDKADDLMHSVDFWLDDLKEELSSDSETQALFAYNLLRELMGAKGASSLQDIDLSWFVQESYTLWKQDRQEKWLKEDITTFIDKADDLMHSVNFWLDDLKEKSSSYSEHRALYAYNFLRELLSLPNVHSFSEIDEQWLRQVDRELIPRALIKEQEKYEAPTSEYIRLLEQAQKLLKLREKITISPYKKAATYELRGSYAIALCKTPDIDEQLGNLYHEIGHIVHQDFKNTELIQQGKKTSSDFLNSPMFKTDLERINTYLELGKKSFDTSTPVGRRVLEVLSDHPQFWSPPENEDKKQEMLYSRAEEQRADLFEIEKLYQNNQLNAILQEIATFSFGDIIAESSDKHPSDFERALYMAGFLVDKGIDINSVFHLWYTTGKCKASAPESLETYLAAPQKTLGALDLINAYEAWKKENLKKQYSIWKQNQQEEWLKNNVTPFLGQVNDLIDSIDFWLEVLKEDPSADAQQKTLFAYNFLRELVGEHTVGSLQYVDLPWFAQKSYTLWKQNRQEKWLEDNITTFPGQANDVVYSVNFWLDDLKKDPSAYSEKRALIAYNFLRELMDAQTVSSLQDIDLTWLVEKSYTLWKQNEQEKWLKNNVTTLLEKKHALIDTFISLLEDLIEDPSSSDDKQQALFAYNFLRELMGALTVSSLQDIDISWFKKHVKNLPKKSKKGIDLSSITKQIKKIKSTIL